MKNTYSINKSNVLDKLLEAINKGVDLLTNKNLDKELYEAYERYVISTVKLVDAYNQTNYREDFMQSSNDFMFNHFNLPNSFGEYNYNPIAYSYNNPLNYTVTGQIPFTWENIGIPNCSIGISSQPETNYQDKIKKILKKLVSILGSIINGHNIDYSTKQTLYINDEQFSYIMPYDGAVIVTAENANIYVNDKKVATILAFSGQKQSCQILVSKADKVEVKYTGVEKPEVTIYPSKRENND